MQLTAELDEDVRISGHKIAGLARSTADMVSIDLIDSIDGTVDALTGIKSVMSGLDRILSAVADAIAATPTETGEYLDPDDEAIDALKQAASRAEDFLTRLVSKRSAIDRDCRLNDHHCEDLHDAYEAASGSIAELIERTESLCSVIISHDLAAEPRDTQEFSTVEGLVKSLRDK